MQEKKEFPKEKTQKYVFASKRKGYKEREMENRNYLSVKEEDMLLLKPPNEGLSYWVPTVNYKNSC